MNRRTFLTAGGLAALGFASGGCSMRRRPTLAAARAPVRLAPVHASWDRIIRTTPGIGIHMIPRSDGIVLGGTSQRGVWTMEPDEPERKRVVDAHIELFSSMRPPR
jgi:hypothetical protein